MSAKAAAFLLVKTRGNTRRLAEKLSAETLIEWSLAVYGPHQIVAYALAEASGELTTCIESVREWSDVAELDARMCKAIPGDEDLKPVVASEAEVAVLLIGTNYKVEKERDVTYKLRGHHAVVLARALWGPDDIVAVIQAPDPESMRNVICDDVKTMKGVLSCVTLYAYPPG